MKKTNMDDLIKEFEEKAKNAQSSYRDLYANDKDIDEAYNVDIHIWRKTGMGNSLQTIAGNKISIMTATASYLTTLLHKNVMSEQELDDMIDMIKSTYKEVK